MRRAETDTMLCERLSRDDREAFEEIYRRYHKQLYFLALKYLKDDGLSEDAVQDVFVKVWAVRKRLNSERNFRGYLFTILKNQVLNRIESDKKKILRSFEKGEVPESKDNVFNNTLDNEYRSFYEKGLALLSERRREIFELKVSGLSNKEIADKLSISENTVKVHYYHSSKFLRSYLARYVGVTILFMLSYYIKM